MPLAVTSPLLRRQATGLTQSVRQELVCYQQFDTHRNILTPFYRFDNIRSMITNLDAVAALASLAQEHRLSVFRLLVQAGEGGLSAGWIADTLGVPPSSLSFHLAHLSRTGLIKQQRQGRMQIYTADYAAMNALIGYLMENCCGGAGCDVNSVLNPMARTKVA